MLYLFSYPTQMFPLSALSGLEIRESYDPQLMSEIGEISLTEAISRFDAYHKAYVAFLDCVPAAFGWVATQNARIGELDYTFRLPDKHRYLWNFRTLKDFRGRGIYPHLLQHILKAEQPQTTHQWIMHAPENEASLRGIQKAGFRLMGQVSVINGCELIFTPDRILLPLNDVLDTFGFKKSEAMPASCWNCSSPYLKKRQVDCCCVSKNKTCTRNIYTEKQDAAYFL
ncbi:GNAT family N-acetyltransferase [Spirosoma gilvum]